VTLPVELAERFEAARPRLLSLAHRITGSHHDAEDAVQTAWTRVQSASLAEVTDVDGWLTTVTARLCLDLIRARKRRGELPLLADDIPAGQLSADEAFLRREDVSRALLVVLGELSPRQRVAYVLHELFAVPFGEVAAILGISEPAAKKLASRARIRLRAAPPPAAGAGHGHLAVVEAFMAAARGGDIGRLVTLMAPDVVRTADPRLLPAGARAEVRGAAAVADETRFFADRIGAAVPVFIDGGPGAVIAPGGHAYALIRFRLDAGLVTRIEIAPYRPGAISFP
jgi:RNA polymerase sigma factor (sigma-70 family)